MKKLFPIVAVSLLVGLSLTGTADAGTHKKKSAPKSCPELNRLDPDSDGAMTLGEAKRRALVVFSKINPDGDRTLELDEVKGRLSKAQFMAADSLIKDGKLGRLEWLILVKKTFRAANPDGDRTIECDELHNAAGKSLYRMLK